MAAIDQLGGMTDDGTQPQNMQAMAGDAQPQAQAATSQQNSNVPQQQQPGGFFKSMLASILQGISAGAGVGAGGDSRHADIGAAFHAGAQGAVQNSPLAIQQRNQAAQQQAQSFQTDQDLKKAQLATAITQDQESGLRLKMMQDEYANPIEAGIKAHIAAAAKSGALSIVATGKNEDDLNKQWAQIHADSPDDNDFLEHKVVPYKDGFALIQIKSGGADTPNHDVHNVLPQFGDLNIPSRDVIQHAGEDNKQFGIRYSNELLAHLKLTGDAVSLKNAATKADTAHETNTLRAAVATMGNQTKIKVADIESDSRLAAANLNNDSKSGDATLAALSKDLVAKTAAVTAAAKSESGVSGWFLPKTEAQTRTVAEQIIAQKKYDAYVAKRQGGNQPPTAAPAANISGFKVNPETGKWEEQ